MADYEKIRKLLDCEMDKIASKPELTDASLSNLYTLVDVIKDLDEIEEKDMELRGYSQRTMVGYYDDGVRGNSYRMGRGNSYRSGGDGRMMNYGYSMDAGPDYMFDHLQQAMNSATTDKEREAIRQVMMNLGK